MKRIGIDLGGTKIHGIVLGEDGRVTASRRAPTPSANYEATVSAVVALIRGLVENDATLMDPTPTIGIGAPGIWQPSRGSMKNCNSTWLNGRPLLTDLNAALGERVRIANDADCFALSEASDGAGAGSPSVFGVILGTGVGGGLVIDGRLVSGPNGLTGEWGHTPMPYFGVHEAAHLATHSGSHQNVLDELESKLRLRQCYCGRRGCIETYLSGPGLQRTYEEVWGERRRSESIAGDADERARLTLDLYCRMLARSLAQIVNIVDPGVIVLGGGLSNVEAIYEPLNRTLAQYVFSGECVTVIKPPRWGAESGVLGAARLWPDNG